MRNEDFINVLRQIKNEGVSFKLMAKVSDIPLCNFYRYLNCNRFPFEIRKKIEDTVFVTFKELYDYE